VFALTWLACADEGPAGPPGPQPLDLPADPAVAAMPVGVRTIELGGHLAEVWYPAAEPGPGEDVDFAAAAPDVVLQATGPLDVPLLPTVAVRDAEPRALAEPQPLVVFSHGFGGTRLQSVTLTTHWAGRGYVVVATDHAGRSLPDLLPCLFSPPLEGCALSFDDPGPADVSELLDALEAPPDWLAPLLDLERVAVTGHSAGGGTTVTVGADDDRVDALVPMAGGDATGGLPTLRLAGTCDAIVPADASAAAHAASPAADGYLEVLGAGHLAFSDLCTLELGRIADEVFAPRDDVSDVFLAQLRALGTDGCPGSVAPEGLRDCEALLPLERSDELLRGLTAAFLDRELRGAAGPLPTAPELSAP
jgi:dienelactone hydrolase